MAERAAPGLTAIIRGVVRSLRSGRRVRVGRRRVTWSRPGRITRVGILGLLLGLTLLAPSRRCGAAAGACPRAPASPPSRAEGGRQTEPTPERLLATLRRPLRDAVAIASRLAGRADHLGRDRAARRAAAARAARRLLRPRPVRQQVQAAEGVLPARLDLRLLVRAGRTSASTRTTWRCVARVFDEQTVPTVHALRRGSGAPASTATPGHGLPRQRARRQRLFLRRPTSYRAASSATPTNAR